MKKNKYDALYSQLLDLANKEKRAVEKIALLTAANLVNSLEFRVGIEDLENGIGNLETAKRIFWSES